MSEHIRITTYGRLGVITLDRPKALNALSLEMVRALAQTLLQWREDPEIQAVLIHSSSERAFCAGGDIRFFYTVARATPRQGSALLEDFFTEEYALNHLIHHYPKPYIAFMDGVVMGGGMGITQAGPSCRMRIVTERTRMAMPEVHIGLFPDVGGSYFLSRTPGQTGVYLGISGETIGAADALYAGLADVFIPSTQLPALLEQLKSSQDADLRDTVRGFASSLQAVPDPIGSVLMPQRSAIDRHFAHNDISAITSSLAQDDGEFARSTLEALRLRSPLMMAVTLAQLRRGAQMDLSDCLRMERVLVRRCFEHDDVLEGIRARVVDKDNSPRWSPSTVDQVTPEMVERFFEPAWPDHAHPLGKLR